MTLATTRGDAETKAPGKGLLVDDPRFDQHLPPPDHPERPQRLDAARRGMQKAAIDFEPVAARPATAEELGRVHRASFLDKFWKLRGHAGYLDPDTFTSPLSVDVACLAAGSAAALVDALLDTPLTKGIALLRPPGHHARPDRAMGFCLLNNIAVAAAQARARGIERVAIVDWDVHHGNGTQEIFLRDPHVLYVSIHQSPLYPGTGSAEEVGEGEGTGYTVNIPISPGAGDAVYAYAFERIVEPVIESYAPGLILVSAGFDASARDPLAQMRLSAEAFGWMARELSALAERSAGGRMAMLLEGGYDLAAIEAGVRSCLRGAVRGIASDLGRAPQDEDVERAATCARRAWAAVE